LIFEGEAAGSGGVSFNFFPQTDISGLEHERILHQNPKIQIQQAQQRIIIMFH